MCGCAPPTPRILDTASPPLAPAIRLRLVYNHRVDESGACAGKRVFLIVRFQGGTCGAIAGLVIGPDMVKIKLLAINVLLTLCRTDESVCPDTATRIKLLAIMAIP